MTENQTINAEGRKNNKTIYFSSIILNDHNSDFACLRQLTSSCIHKACQLVIRN